MISNSYFSHDSNARNDGKVVRLRMKHGAAGYGVYFMILERLREEKDYASVKDYNMIAFDLRVDAGLVKSVVEDFGLFAFTEDGECFYSESFNRRMSMKDDVKTKRSEAGKRGNAKRWGDGKTIANATETNRKAIANDEETIANATETNRKAIANDEETIANATENHRKERKVKERKENVEDDGARTHAREPDDENEWSKELAGNKQFVETVAMKNAVGCDEVMALISEFDSECEAKGIRHADYGDYRRHCYDWVRVHLSKLAGRAAQRKKAPPAQTIAIPTEQEMRAEEEHKADEEKKRVLGIYEGARKGNKRFVAIVREWATNGTLSRYGLEPLE